MSTSAPSTSTPDEDARRLTAALGSSWSPVQVVASTGSTNADLADSARSGARAPGSVLLSWHQSTGRGRLDRRWSAPPGTSAACSVLLDLAGVASQRVPWLSLVVGLAVVSGVQRVTGLSPELKWPNDVLVDGRKLCGVLAERVETPDGPRAVLGFGLNLTQTVDELAVPTATSLTLAGAVDVDRVEVLARVLVALAERTEAWRAGAPELLTEYRTRCSSIGRDVVVHLPDGSQVTGRGVDVDATGRLVLQRGTERLAFSAGDVVHLR